MQDVLALEQSAEKWPFSAAGGGVTRQLRPPLDTGLQLIVQNSNKFNADYNRIKTDVHICNEVGQKS